MSNDSMPPRVLATMVTTTSYGTWLPGDARGYVDEGRILPGDPGLFEHARSLLSGSPVYFDRSERAVLFRALRDGAEEFKYRLTDASVQSWHVHWIIEHGYDPVARMVGRLKTRMRQALNRGRIWTEGYCHRCLFTERQIGARRRYVGRHPGCRMTEGRVLRE